MRARGAREECPTVLPNGVSRASLVKLCKRCEGQQMQHHMLGTAVVRNCKVLQCAGSTLR